MSKSAAMDLVMQFMGKQNTIPTPVPFIRLLGDHASAAFLSQCLYWGERTADPNGEFHKTHDEWHEELVLSPDQVRRCVKTCGGLVHVRRKGVPARNYYRADRERIAFALEALAAGHPDPLSCWETQHQDIGKPDNKSLGNPTARHGQTPRQVVQQTPQLVTEPTSEPTQNLQKNKNTLAAHAAAGELGQNVKTDQPQTAEAGTHHPAQVTPQAPQEPSPPTGLEQVPPAAPPVPLRRLSDAARLIEVWNTQRGSLPEVQGLNEGRKKAIKKLIRDCDGDIDRAAGLLLDATREVAQDDYWQTHRYGFDNLVPGKVFGRAEAWRSRQGQGSTTTAGQPSAPLSTSTYRVGQRVSYKREAYTVEHITDTFIDLYDEENGSSRVLLSSSDWAAIRPLEGRNP